MLSRRHFSFDTARQGDCEVARFGCHRICDVGCLSLLLWEYALVDIVVRTGGIWKEGKISEGRTASSSAVMHSTESGHVPVLCRKAALVAWRVDISNSFCHTSRMLADTIIDAKTLIRTVWKRRTGEHVT